MSTASRVFSGGRALFAAAKSSTRASSKAKPLASAKKTNAKSSSTKSEKARAPSNPNSGFLKLVPVSPALQSFLGVAETNRADAVKKVWEHVKLNNLQNPSNKREIYCDEKLKTIFEGKDKVGFSEIAKLMSCHFVKTSS